LNKLFDEGYIDPDYYEFYREVEKELIGLGYTKSFVHGYRFEIQEHFENKKSIEDAVNYIA